MESKLNDEQFMIKMRTKLIAKKMDFADVVEFTRKHGRKIAHTTLTRAYNAETELRPDTRTRIELAVNSLVKGKS